MGWGRVVVVVVVVVIDRNEVVPDGDQFLDTTHLPLFPVWIIEIEFVVTLLIVVVSSGSGGGEGLIWGGHIQLIRIQQGDQNGR